MKVWLDVKKREGSCNCSRNGALLVAMRSSCLDWKADTPRPLESIRAKQQLRERLDMSVAELNDNPHASYADHESRGVFGGFTVLDRRGYWRIVWDAQDRETRRSIRDSADTHSNFGTY